MAQEADWIGRLWRGLDWRTEAVRPDAPGQYRLLAEFLWYLEREDVDVVSPARSPESDLTVLPDVNAVVVRWKQFRDLVLDELRKRLRPDPDLEVKWQKRWDPEGRGGERLACGVTLRYGVGWEGTGWPALSRLLMPAPPKFSWRGVDPVAPSSLDEPKESRSSESESALGSSPTGPTRRATGADCKRRSRKPERGVDSPTRRGSTAFLWHDPSRRSRRTLRLSKRRPRGR